MLCCCTKKFKAERRIIMANIENKETSSRPINKTTETLIKELETMSDTGLHEMFLFFYKLNHAHSNMLDSNKLPCLYLKFFSGSYNGYFCSSCSWVITFILLSGGMTLSFSLPAVDTFHLSMRCFIFTISSLNCSSIFFNLSQGYYLPRVLHRNQARPPELE